MFNPRFLRVKPVSTAMVPNYARVGVRCFVGYRFDASLSPHGGFAFQPGIVDLPCRSEFLLALKDGDLIPADKDTALLAGIPFQKS